MNLVLGIYVRTCLLEENGKLCVVVERETHSPQICVKFLELQVNARLLRIDEMRVRSPLGNGIDTGYKKNDGTNYDSAHAPERHRVLIITLHEIFF